jgi:hypothetical protein
MDIILTIIRLLTAVVSPLATLAFIILIMAQLRGATGRPPAEDETCLRCGASLSGGEGQFHFAESVGNARERAATQQYGAAKNPILGSETHFVCDGCARRYLRNEIAQMIALALPYPLFLYVLLPLLFPGGIFASFLIETLLIVLSVSGLIAAYDLYRAVRNGQTPLDEARDRVAIGVRRDSLGKKLSYYSRNGLRQLES